jgi:peptide-methionine (R)-S-oxide reductase
MAEKRKGTFACAGCDLPLFSSDTKFESGTGWPSFYAPLKNAVGTSVDRSLLIARTEGALPPLAAVISVTCSTTARRPPGLRYCMNGVALKFIPTDSPA